MPRVTEWLREARLISLPKKVVWGVVLALTKTMSLYAVKFATKGLAQILFWEFQLL